MDSMSAFMQGEAARSRGSLQRVFDWDEAARLIRERQPETASAGLESDWEWTGGEIYSREDGINTDSYTYLSSNWATPQLDLDGEIIDCWKYERDTPGWDAGTKWPESARKILAGGDFIDGEVLGEVRELE